MVRHFLPAEGTQNGKSKCLLQLKKERNWLRCQSSRSHSKIKIKSNTSSNLTFDRTKNMFSYISTGRGQPVVLENKLTIRT
jgi:rRNA maturation protein Rpf1